MSEGKESAASEAVDHGYEVQDVSMRSVHAIGVFITVFIVTSLIVLNQFFTDTVETEVYEAVLKPESAQLRDLRAHEDEVLTSYAVIDKQAGVYQIPISRAMQLLAEEAYKNR